MAFWASGASEGIQDYLDLRDAIESGEGSRGKGGRAVCDAYAGNPTLGAAAVSQFPAGNAAMQGLCAPYWDGPDGYDPPSPGGEAPLFQGGQCPGEAYEVFVASISPSTGQSNEVRLPGTFQGPVSITPPTNPLNASGQPLELSWQYTVNEGRPDEDSRTSVSDGAPTFRVERADGQPDDCGDPDPVLTPAAPGSPPPGRGYGEPRDIGEPGNPIPITVRPPQITPDGPVFPIEGPGGTVPFSPSTPNPSDPIVPPSEGPPQDVSGSGDVDTEEPEGVDETGLETIGYRWSVTDGAPQFQSVIPGTSPRVYSRVVGSLQLKMRGESGIIYSDNLQITSEQGSIIRASDGLQVVGCSYNVLPSLAGLVLTEIRSRRNDG